MANEKVTRYVRSDVRAEGESDGNTLVGYAAIFGVESQVLFDRSVCNGPFVEIIDPKAFDRTLKESPDVRALYNHNTDFVLGRTKSGTLTLSVDETGLAFVVQLGESGIAQMVKESVKRGDIDGCSWGFCVVKDEVVERPGLPALRTLYDVDLYEITPACAFPAYLDAYVSVRSHDDGMKATPRLDYARRTLDLID